MTRSTADWPRCSRRVHWISSVTGDLTLLAALDEQMGRFYGRADAHVRDAYQRMLDGQDDEPVRPQSVRHLMPQYVCDLAPGSVLEIGCGNGRVYRQLRSYGLRGDYAGTEIAAPLVEENRRAHPEASWEIATAYELPYDGERFDLCFSLYVLEHLVYPGRALREMLRVLRPGGRLVLVFPDFAAGGILASQQIGLSPHGTALQKLRAGHLVDAVVSLYDSRLRIRRLLAHAARHCGPFPVNARPLCLSHPELMAPDVDAVYIASKDEIHCWAEAAGLTVDYPAGTEGEMSFQAFMVLTKPIWAASTADGLH
jgi:SAM-dependent methyltransferase